MILADTSVWIEHIRAQVTELAELVEHDRLRIHPFVIGEIALGSIADRGAVLADLRALTQLGMATDEEVTALIERERLFGAGIGWVGAHLLASTLLADGTLLWTRDRRLEEVARRLNVSAGL